MDALIKSRQNALVFVYGTLKRGFPNYGLLADKGDDSQFICSAKTQQKHPMVVSLSRHVPFLLPEATDDSLHIEGEVFLVSRQTVLKELDILEGVEEDYYERKRIPLEITEVESLWRDELSEEALQILRSETEAYIFKKHPQLKLSELVEMPKFASYPLKEAEFYSRRKADELYD